MMKSEKGINNKMNEEMINEILKTYSLSEKERKDKKEEEYRENSEYRYNSFIRKRETERKERKTEKNGTKETVIIVNNGRVVTVKNFTVYREKTMIKMEYEKPVEFENRYIVVEKNKINLEIPDFEEIEEDLIKMAIKYNARIYTI